MALEGRPVRALCLLSGSLDSQLAVRVLQAQGIRVAVVTFTSPLFDAGAARRAAAQLGAEYLAADFTAGLLRVLSGWRPRGAEPEPPCVACRTAMVEQAGRLLAQEGFDFISTGEVLNQRVPSQDGESLERIAQQSGYYGFVLRPLSAGLLPPTEVEERGWVERGRLLSLEGRARRAQIELAGQYGIEEYPSPAATCRLAEPSLAARVADLQEHGGVHGSKELHLLRLGRHFRIGRSTKLVVGRNEEENMELEGLAELYDLVLKPENMPGPTGLLPFTATPDEIRLAAAVCARYADLDGAPAVSVRVRSSREMCRVDVAPASAEAIEKLRI
ncbi:MAG: tRNA 4-thiouridine(8) synthase ThiI [Kiritimatiellae bacterium]|nr:tRNA 4-thiouridine(8) synthase ThiI [Kiritimatiellia bacterium]